MTVCWASGRDQYVEVVDDARELRGEAGILVKLANAEGQVLTLDTTDPNAATVLKANFPDKIADRPNNPKVRRWDGAQAPVAGWFELEDGVQIKFEAGEYHVGDYWLIPARTATADVEWPRDDRQPAQSDPPAACRHRASHLQAGDPQPHGCRFHGRPGLPRAVPAVDRADDAALRGR